MARRERILSIPAALIFFCAIAAAQTQPISRPTSGPEGQPIKATITAVRGMVEVKMTDADKWQPAKVDMVLGQGASFRTGPRSAVQFVMPPDQTITLDRLGTVTLLTAIKQASGKIKTDVGMKYGRTRYDIATGGVEHESTIRSPNSTLAIRGTMVSLQDERPFAPRAVSLTGRAEFNSFKKMAVAFGGNAKAKIDGEKGTAAETAQAQNVVDPNSALARDQAEQALVDDLISRGAVVTLNTETNLRIIKGGTVPGPQEIVSLLPGNLNFVLTWQGNANLDLSINTVVTGETVYPGANLTVSPSGGKTAFDHQGGPNGGLEIISWPKNFPRDLYPAGANHISGPAVPVNFSVYLDGKLATKTVTVFENGQFVQKEVGVITTFGPDGLPVFSSQVNTTVAPRPPGSGVEMTALGIADLSDLPPAQNSLKPGAVGGKGRSKK